MGTFHSLEGMRVKSFTEVTRTPVEDVTKEKANVPDKQLPKFVKRIKVEKSNFQIIRESYGLQLDSTQQVLSWKMIKMKMNPTLRNLTPSKETDQSWLRK